MQQQEEHIALTLGAGEAERVLPDAGGLLRQYRRFISTCYQDYTPVTSRDHLYPEDLALTLLLSSQAGWRAVRSLCRCGSSLDLAALPDTPLEHTTAEERQLVAQLIARVAQWPGFGASLATKVLHKKRPRLIPILDNQAIFGAYMNPDWPRRLARTAHYNRCMQTP